MACGVLDDACELVLDRCCQEPTQITYWTSSEVLIISQGRWSMPMMLATSQKMAITSLLISEWWRLVKLSTFVIFCHLSRNQLNARISWSAASSATTLLPPLHIENIWWLFVNRQPVHYVSFTIIFEFNFWMHGAHYPASKTAFHIWLSWVGPVIVGRWQWVSFGGVLSYLFMVSFKVQFGCTFCMCQRASLS